MAKNLFLFLIAITTSLQSTIYALHFATYFIRYLLLMLSS